MAGDNAKKHQCPQCMRCFTRPDHLKRHQLHHTGVKPYLCIFCRQNFSRTDYLYDHYKNCEQRQGRDIPDPKPKGRRRHACQPCIAMKRKCDGGHPCNICQLRNLACSNEIPTPEDEVPPADQSIAIDSAGFAEQDQPDTESNAVTALDSGHVDRLSIRALLLGGNATFVEDFNLPSVNPVPESRPEEFHQAANPHYWQIPEDNNIFSWYDMIPPDLSFEIVDHMDLFDIFQMAPNGVYDNLGCVYPDARTSPIALPSPYSNNNYDQVEDPCVLTLLNSMLQQLQKLDLDDMLRKTLANEVQFLIKTPRIKSFVSLYFENWHLNSPIIHIPSFDMTQVCTTLLGAIAFVGAMYSKDPLESALSRKLLSLMELVVFGSQTFSKELEISRTWSEPQRSEEDEFQWSAFEDLQAAYLIVTTQYWGGSKQSKDRAMEQRFAEVIKVARNLGLTKVRHLKQDRISETLWIRKEIQIRTMSIIRLLDCAFRIYSNYPCKLTHSELEVDLPCSHSVFAAEHPFAEDEFTFNRRPTVLEALKLLLTEPDAPTAFTQPAANAPEDRLHLRELKPNVLDLFILIHLLFVFTLDYTWFLAVIGIAEENGASLFAHSGGTRSPDARGTAGSAVARALACWRKLWQESCKQAPGHGWEAAGMFKNGLRFWLVLQLLVSEKRTVELSKKLEVNCKDSLAVFRSLLKENAE